MRMLSNVRSLRSERQPNNEKVVCAKCSEEMPRLAGQVGKDGKIRHSLKGRDCHSEYLSELFGRVLVAKNASPAESSEEAMAAAA